LRGHQRRHGHCADERQQPCGALRPHLMNAQHAQGGKYSGTHDERTQGSFKQ
jgi:hypothetical protein